MLCVPEYKYSCLYINFSFSWHGKIFLCIRTPKPSNQRSSVISDTKCKKYYLILNSKTLEADPLWSNFSFMTTIPPPAKKKHFTCQFPRSNNKIWVRIQARKFVHFYTLLVVKQNIWINIVVLYFYVRENVWE